MNRDVMLGTLNLHLSATRTGVTVSYYDQDYTHHTGLKRIRIGYLTPDDLRNGGADAVVDITPILPIAVELFKSAGGNMDVDAA